MFMEKKYCSECIKKVPGDELFETVYSISHFQGIKDSMNSCFTPMSKGVKVGDDMFVFLHELGHAKDHQTQKGFLSFLKIKDTLIIKIFKRHI